MEGGWHISEGGGASWDRVALSIGKEVAHHRGGTLNGGGGGTSVRGVALSMGGWHIPGGGV